MSLRAIDELMNFLVLFGFYDWLLFLIFLTLEGHPADIHTEQHG